MSETTACTGLLKIFAHLGNCNLHAAVGFLAGHCGESQASLTGRLIAADGRLLAIGTLSRNVVEALAEQHPYVLDFADAHGCDSLGRRHEDEPAEEVIAAAWRRAHASWTTFMSPLLPFSP